MLFMKPPSTCWPSESTSRRSTLIRSWWTCCFLSQWRRSRPVITQLRTSHLPGLLTPASLWNLRQLTTMLSGDAREGSA